MKHTNLFRKTLFALLAVSALVFAGCRELDDDDDDVSPSLTISRESLTITSALGGYTKTQLSASLSGYSAGLSWYSTDTSIISVESAGSTATLLCEGSAGTAKVGVRTTDGALEAACMVTVVLSATPASPVSDVSVVEGSATTKGFTLTWTDPSISSKVIIDVFETEAARTTANALAASSSDTEPTVYKTYAVSMGEESYTIEDLVTNADGKTYYFSVYGFINGKRSFRYENGSATLSADTTPPANVTDIALESDAGDHTLVVSWTEPADEDYKSVTVAISPATDFAGEALSASVAIQEVAKGLTHATFTKLAANTEYTFTFKTNDINGNEQETGATAAFTTAADTTAPAAVTEASAAAGRTAATLSWTDPSDADFKEIRVYQGDSTSYTTVEASSAENKANTLQVSGLAELTAYTFHVKAVDYNGNESAAVDVSATTANPVATNVSATVTDVSFAEGDIGKLTVTVTWSAPSAHETDASGNAVTYAYSVALKNGDSVVETNAVGTAVLTTTFTGLTYGTEYTYEVTTIPSDEGEFISDASKLTKNALGFIQVKNHWGGRILVPFVSGTVSNVNCVIVQVTEPTDGSKCRYIIDDMDYPYWIVREALNDADGYFSLEAADEAGNPSGLFCYFSSTTPSGNTNYDVDGTGWGSGASPHCFYGNETTIGTDVANASFKFDEATGKTAIDGCSPFYTVKTSSSKYFWSGNSNPGLKDSADTSSGDYSWCYKVVSE